MIATFAAIALMIADVTYLRCSGHEFRSGPNLVAESFFVVQNYKVDFKQPSISYFTITNDEVQISEDVDIADTFALASKDAHGPYETFIRVDRYTGYIEHTSKSPNLDLSFYGECRVIDGPHQKLF